MAPVGRRTAALFVLIIGLVLLSRLVVRSPVAVDVSFRLGAAAAELRQLDVRYERADDHALARRVTFRYEAGAAPAEQVHHTRLAPGRYLLQLTLLGSPTGPRTLERPLSIEGSGEHAYIDIE